MIDKITSSPVFQNVGKFVDKGCKKIGSALCKSDCSKADKFIKAIEPTGANNSFIGLCGLMGGMVILPRVMTAAKRNPDNKEATRDEIVEILFRDIQTVLIILFGLKASDALIGRFASRATGLPMTNKPYKALFETNKKGIPGLIDKGKELIFHPIQKVKTGCKNILDTINPLDGVRKYTNDEFVDNYSGYTTIEGVQKMYTSIKEHAGNPDKIFNNVMDSIIEKQENLIKEQKTMSNAGFSTNVENAGKVLDALKDAKEKGVDVLKDESLDENVKSLIVDFHKDSNNKLVSDGKKLSAITKTLALLVEVTYLGFGLPALNQKRLEKKYLKEHDEKLNIKEKRIKHKDKNQNALPSGLNLKNAARNSEQQIFKQFIR